jgi:hypothetical protein
MMDRAQRARGRPSSSRRFLSGKVASVRARLLLLAKASGQSFNLVLTRFALERLLFRLSQSPYVGRFVLKGAMLMMSWFDDPHRGTRDLDLLGLGNLEPDPMLETFREILAQLVDDDVTFDAETLRVDRIREGLENGGLRLRVVASISGARINLTVDTGFGDALEPGVEELDYPSMLDFAAPRIRACARKTVIAETKYTSHGRVPNPIEPNFEAPYSVHPGKDEAGAGSFTAPRCRSLASRRPHPL